MSESKTFRLWKPVELTEKWKQCDTATIDDLSPSWFERRGVLQENSQEYKEFIEELKREHAIETGIVEKMYDLEKGITETFIKEGFLEAYISHNDTNVPIPTLFAHLKDHFAAVEFVFDVVKEQRELTIGFIKELHALVTQAQDFSEGRDQFGHKTKIELIKGEYKKLENNPMREDGTLILYCPPEQVSSEMENLIRIYNDAEREGVHLLICATWFHHAFTTIHPFQDGNGRVARLLASLILIKHRLFPFTVLREEARVRYIGALEKADLGEPQEIVDYFAEVQKRHIEKALNIREVASSSFDKVAEIFSGKLADWQKSKTVQREQVFASARASVFEFCLVYLNEKRDELNRKMDGTINISTEYSKPASQDSHYYERQIIKYAKKHDYFFNRKLPKGWITFRIELDKEQKYQLGITVHHYGYDDRTLAIGAFLEYLNPNQVMGGERIDSSLPLEIKPHVISITGDIQSKEKRIRVFLETAMTMMLAHISSEL